MNRIYQVLDTIATGGAAKAIILALQVGILVSPDALVENQTRISRIHLGREWS